MYKRQGIKVLGLSAYSNVKLLEEQAREFHPKKVCMVSRDAAAELKTKLADTDIKVISGEDGLEEIAALDGAKTVVTAVVGISGLKPTVAAIKAGKNIALANKETMVTAGHIAVSYTHLYPAIVFF